MSCQRDGAVDHRRKLRTAEGLERDPELERVETAAKVEQGRLSLVVRNALVLVEFGVEIVGVHLDRIEVLGVAYQKCAARNGLPQKFVEVDRKRIGMFDSGQLGAMIRRRTTAHRRMRHRHEATCSRRGQRRRAEAEDRLSRNRWCRSWPQSPWETDSAIAVRRAQRAALPDPCGNGRSMAMRTTESVPRPNCGCRFLHGEMRDFGAENSEAGEPREAVRIFVRTSATPCAGMYRGPAIVPCSSTASLRW